MSCSENASGSPIRSVIEAARLELASAGRNAGVIGALCHGCSWSRGSCWICRSSLNLSSLAWPSQKMLRSTVLVESIYNLSVDSVSFIVSSSSTSCFNILKQIGIR